MAQYPLQKTVVRRTIKNVMGDGSLILLPDSGSSKVYWQLNFNALTADEQESLKAHFRLCNGCFRGFVFLDPANNLFLWSSDLTNSAWTGVQTQIQKDISDPVGGADAFRLTNVGQGLGTFYQSLSIPSYFTYCLSGYVRTNLPSVVGVFIKGSQATEDQAVSTNSSWQRFSITSTFAEQQYSLSAGLTLPPGQQVELFGLQLEAQRVASEYRATSARNGIYQDAHYAMNELLITAEGPGVFSTSMIIEAVE